MVFSEVSFSCLRFLFPPTWFVGLKLEGVASVLDIKPSSKLILVNYTNHINQLDYFTTTDLD